MAGGLNPSAGSPSLYSPVSATPTTPTEGIVAERGELDNAPSSTTSGAHGTLFTTRAPITDRLSITIFRPSRLLGRVLAGRGQRQPQDTGRPVMSFEDNIRRPLRNTLTRGRVTVTGAIGRARQQRRVPRPRRASRRVAAIPAAAPIATGRRRRWVRAVDGELINLDGCDYVAVEKEHADTYAVIARMHGAAANWVLARYDSREEATQAQDWLASHLQAQRVDHATGSKPADDAAQKTE